MSDSNGSYWNAIADEYQSVARISTDDFHFGPLIPGDSVLRILPADVEGWKCLEIGCGGAQNSVCLAKRGAVCAAFDVSAAQIAVARRLADENGVELDLRVVSMEDAPERITGEFDMVHSVFSLEFASDPARVVAFAARRLKPGGCFLLSTGHPLASFEWVELDGDGGMFVNDYFAPPPDVRYDDEGREEIRSRTYPLGKMVKWISDAGMRVVRLEEPAAVPDLLESAPYSSEGWMEYAEIFARIPPAAVFFCRKPLSPFA